MATNPVREQLWLSDFATIFAHMWYRDFPLHASRTRAQRSDWTIHHGVAVRSTADLLGLLTYFEHGGRTDAVLKDNRKTVVTAVEWEWDALHRPKVNELDKLKDRCTRKQFKGIQFACLIGYIREGTNDTVLADITSRWTKGLPPLLLVAIHFEWKGKKHGRLFDWMRFHRIEAGQRNLIREQPAYPWKVERSRWEKK